ncbi:unnamed protein product [Zymoseptoria tritici ST99CH_3D1]|nr:unnamed protein product [Zymoseptoria tritici ST99CH_3D1]
MARYNLRPRRSADTDTNVSQALAVAPDQGTATANAVEPKNGDNMTVMATRKHPATSSSAMDLTETRPTPAACAMSSSKINVEAYGSDAESFAEKSSDEEYPDEEDSDGGDSDQEEDLNMQTLPVNTPNCGKTLETTEICEQFLIHLSKKDMLRCLRVSQKFNATIGGSITLQRRLFLAPQTKPIIGKAIPRDPVMALRPPLSLAENGGHKGIARTDRLVRMNSFFFRQLYENDYSETQTIRINNPNQKKWRKVKSSLSSPALGEMFITQPPMTYIKLGL